MRTLSVALALAGMMIPVRATTLEKLPLDEMIQKSTSIVRAKVVDSYGAMLGQDIYTCYRLQVLENLKSATPQEVDVAVPGGVANGLRQMVAGAPTLNPGVEYIVFLWTSRSGLTQVIGLSQGLFSVIPDLTNNATAGNAIVVRPAATETMLDANGNVATDQTLRLLWSDLRARIQQQLGAGN